LSVAWLLGPDGLLKVYKEWCEKGKYVYKVCFNHVGENALLMLEVRREWAD